MAAQFVGYEIVVTLKSPPECRVQGLISAVVGQRLTLQNVTLLWNGQRIPEYHIESSGISDLKLTGERVSTAGAGYEAPDSQNIRLDADLTPGQQATPVPASTSSQNDTQPQSQPQPFVDPAILSFSRPQEQAHGGHNNNVPAASRRVIDSPVMIGESGMSEPSRNKPSASAHGTSIPNPENMTAATAAATLSAPFSDLELNPRNNDIPEGRGNGVVKGPQQQSDIPAGRKSAGPLDAPLKYTGKRSRRGGRNKAQKDGGLQSTGIPEGNEPAPSPAGSKKKDFSGNGWRQTAFMEPAGPADATPSPSTKKGRGRQRKGKTFRNNAEESGWATEDATDIQEMGDFDFQSNLSKFDKRRVFDEIRNDDTKAGQDRLVSINRLARPGTSGGKNLHYTENVLDPSPPHNMDYVSESGETGPDEAAGFQVGGGRASSRGGSSKTSVQAGRSRKSSAVLAASATSSQFAHINRGPLASSRTSSPRPHMRPASPLTRPSESPNGSFYIMSTNRQCPVVSPLQMFEVEQLAISELGLTDDIITENAGRGIAEAAVSLASSLLSSQILAFAGNHRTGSRAVSAARHFRNRGYRVTLCILGFDRESEFTDAFRKQVDIFKKAGGRVMRWEEISPRLSTIDNTPGLVIDALFGVHVTFEDLRSEDQATAFEMISWANRSGADILSVDMPFGLSSTTGEAMSVQGTGLSTNASYVVCLGAPKIGLLNAVATGEYPWQIVVADVGISQFAWRKFGTKRRHGVDFGNKWVVPVQYHPANA